MPVLTYCLSELQSVAAPEKGVGELSVESLEQDGIRCFFSRSSSDQLLGRPARETALAFHNVIASIFRQVAVIPFRFPTILGDERELRSHLSEQGSTYLDALIRLRSVVQMELHVFPKSSSSGQEDRHTAGASATGGQYLRARQLEQRELSDLSAALQRSGGQLIHGWRERTSAHGLRCFALIERTAIDDFKNLILRTHVSPELLARVTGPWPASEFIKSS